MSDPPAGWYDNPGGGGQRFWDGAAWSNQIRVGTDGDRARPNEHGLALASLFGVISYIALLVFLNPHMRGSSAYGAGQLLVPAAVAAA
jgi:hypothetical protein